MAPRRGTGQITENNKGGWMLVCEGHLYRVNRKTANKVYWKCVNNKECTGTAQTLLNIDVSASVTVNLGKPHLHDIDRAGIQMHQVLTKINIFGYLNFC